MSVTGNAARKITVQYPEEKHHRVLIFETHALRRYSNGERERCITCKLCETDLPSNSNYDRNRTALDDGSQRTTRYIIDLTKCIFLWFLCEETTQLT